MFVVVVGDETLSEKCLIRVRVTRNSCYSSNTALRVTTRDLGRRLGSDDLVRDAAWREVIMRAVNIRLP